jgi:hypothetical protein
MRLLILFALLALPAFSVTCNPLDQSGCPTQCLTGPSFTTIPGSAYGAAPNGVDVACGVSYGSGSAYLADIYMPHGLGIAANTPQAPCIHGGGFSQSVDGRLGCLGFANHVQTVQRWGIILIPVDYTLSGTAIWPAGLQALRCFTSTLGTNSPSATWPGNPHDIRIFGTSAGGNYAVWLAWIPDSSQGGVGSQCSVTLNTNYTITKIVGVSVAIDLAGPGYPASSGDGGVYQPAINGLLGCSTQINCAAADVTLQASPLLYITNGNRSRLNVPIYWQVGASDPTIVFSGQLAEAITAGAALTNPINWSYWNGPCCHQSDRSSFYAGQEIPDAMNWLLGQPAGPLGGNVH